MAADCIPAGQAAGKIKRRYPKRGSLKPYMLAHMYDDCPKWPFARGKGGYGKIQHEGRVVDVHRLVCTIVNGPPPSPRHQAAHSCGKGHEGCFGAMCIQWKTPYENQNDRRSHGTMMEGESHYACKISDDDVKSIRAMAHEYSQMQIARRFGISRAYV